MVMGRGLEAVGEGQGGVRGTTSRALRRFSRWWVPNRELQDPDPGARTGGR